MSTDIIRLEAGDFEEAMNFLDEVFAEHAPHDFAKMLPSIYQPTDKHMRCNYAIRDGGRLAAIVGVFPIQWSVGKEILRVAGIGGVSVHKDFRGKGYMKTLMNHVVLNIKSAGYDLSYLGGRRQRYAYFGYEVAGTTYRLLFLRDNIKHEFKGQAQCVTLEPLNNSTSALSDIISFHNRQLQCCDRLYETFIRHLRSWHSEPLVASDASGEIIGYLCPDRENRVANELVAGTPEDAAQIVRAWSDHVEDTVTVCMQPPADRFMHRLNSFAEHIKVEPGGNWQVFNWQRVVNALMWSQNICRVLPEGSVVIEIEGIGCLALTVDSEEARCERTDKQPDLIIGQFNAMRLLFGPGEPALSYDLPKHAAILRAWCPLPLGFSHQDHV